MPTRRGNPAADPIAGPSPGPAAVSPVTAETVARVGLANPVVLVLLLAGLFDGLSGNPVDSLLLLGTGGMLARSRAEPAATPRRRRRRLSRPWALLTGLVLAGYALIAGAASRFSWPATAAVALPGVAVLVLVGRSPFPARKRPAAGPAGAAAWASVFVGIALWELLNLLLQPSFTTGSYDHPTLSVLADPMLASHPGRSAALGVWLAAGWYLAER